MSLTKEQFYASFYIGTVVNVKRNGKMQPAKVTEVSPAKAPQTFTFVTQMGQNLFTRNIFTLSYEQIQTNLAENTLQLTVPIFPKWIKVGSYVMVSWNSTKSWCICRITNYFQGKSIEVEYTSIVTNNRVKCWMNLVFPQEQKNTTVIREAKMLQFNSNGDNHSYVAPIRSKECRKENYCLIQDSYKLIKNDLSKLTILGNMMDKKGNLKNENDYESKETEKELVNIGFSYNIQKVYQTLNEILLTKYSLLCDLNILCIVVSYLLESKLSLNIPRFDAMIGYKSASNLNLNLNKSGINDNCNNNTITNVKIWKASKSHSIKFEFKLKRSIDLFYGLEIDIKSKDFKKNACCYAKLRKTKKVRLGYYHNRFHYRVMEEYYLSQKDTINDINSICCDDPNTLLLYVKDNQAQRVDLTKYLKLEKDIRYEIEIVVSKNTKVENWFEMPKSVTCHGRTFTMGLFTRIKYHQSWMPPLRMLLGTKAKAKSKSKMESSKNLKAKPVV